MHSHNVAHQTFAQKLVNWLQGIMDYSSSFRALLGKFLKFDQIFEFFFQFFEFFRSIVTGMSKSMWHLFKKSQTGIICEK